MSIDKVLTKNGVSKRNSYYVLEKSLFVTQRFQEIGEEMKLITLVMTNLHVCLIKEDNVFWPLPQSNKIR